MNVEQIERQPALRICAPQWFEDPDFLNWIKNTPSVATWHNHNSNNEDSEYMDVFVAVEPCANGEGSDQPGYEYGMPDKYWDQVVQAVKESGFNEHNCTRHVIVWVSPI